MNYYAIASAVLHDRAVVRGFQLLALAYGLLTLTFLCLGTEVYR